MFTEFMMMSLVEMRLEKPILADDFSAWFAGWKGTWKPRRVAAATPGPEKGVAGSKVNPRLPTPILSPRAAFLKSITRPSSIISSQSSSPTPPPAPLFVTDYFEVRPSPKGGLGAFAIKDIAKDTVIFSEKALFCAEIVEVFHAYENLTPIQRKEYRSLYCYSGVDNERLLAIFKTNRFEITRAKSGIFAKSSRFNHACHPHATCTYSIDRELEILTTRAILDIIKGQEITISYCGRGEPTNLYDNYGFYCDCPKCPPPKEAAANARYLREYRR